MKYAISVADKEDGSMAEGKIKAEEVAVTFDYVPVGFDPIEIASKQSGVENAAILNLGKNLIEASDCKSCHQYEEKSIGPSYEAVAEKYPNSEENTKYLLGKIINGGSGVWGEHGMAAQPSLCEADARRMVDLILAMDNTQANIVSLPLSGKVKCGNFGGRKWPKEASCLELPTQTKVLKLLVHLADRLHRAEKSIYRSSNFGR